MFECAGFCYMTQLHDVVGNVASQLADQTFGGHAFQTVSDVV